MTIPDEEYWAAVAAAKKNPTYPPVRRSRWTWSYVRWLLLAAVPGTFDGIYFHQWGLVPILVTTVALVAPR